jgi:hypothetical protein
MQIPKPGSTFTFPYGKRGIIESVEVRNNDPNNFPRVTITGIMTPQPPSTNLPAINTSEAIFGVPGFKKSYRGTLVGNIRIRYRTEAWATVFVRDPYRIRQYLLLDKGDYVTHGPEISQNQRATPRST